ISHITVVGDISQDEAMAAFRALETKWAAKDVAFPEYAVPAPPTNSELYFVDTPGARQSVIYIGYPALSPKDPDFHPATVMNYKLGGSFNGFVNLVLREEKGYTYGARTGFSGYGDAGVFAASSQVQGTATKESVEIFRDLMLEYREGISEEDLAFTKSALIKANALGFETLGSLMGMLNDIALYGYPDDYVKRQEAFVKALTLDQHKELARRYIDPGRMIYLVVGDAATQMKPLANLGLGKPTLIGLD
ncbi:MAG TPA: insulinase family protein, partial [Candidatus Aminicenantes bacterium]|nr:insulinase family protein [Candidatus Aminicenantes bacterium]